MNEKLICENEILNNNYKYYLIESLDDVVKETEDVVKYGIKISKYNRDGEVVDSKCVPHIFESREKMVKAIRILNKLRVTPITLEDVVIDNVYTR